MPGHVQFADDDDSMYKDDGGEMTKLFIPAVLSLLFCAAAVIGGEKSVFDYTLNTIDSKRFMRSTTTAAS